MIISTRDHLEKMEKALPFQSLIDQIVNCNLGDLPNFLMKNMTWEKPTGDLFHWIPVLNRFDEILETQISKYGLDEEYPKLQVISDKDQEIIIACLRFSSLLLENCISTNIYASSDRIHQLILSPTIEVRLRALETAYAIAECYAQNSSNKLMSSKELKMKVLQIARSYPPQVPSSSFRKTHNDGKEESDMDHYSLLDSLSTKKKYPTKWKLLDFHYYNQSGVEMGKNRTVSNEDKKIMHNKSKGHSSSRKSGKEAGIHEGLESFQLSEESARKLSLEQIFDKAAESIPKEFWFKFSTSALVLKAFNQTSYDSIKLREKLMRMKCLSVAYICCMCPNEYAASKYFEWDPYIFSYLTDLILPDNMSEILPELYFTALRTLEGISLKRVWSSDIVRCTGGNVNHGILFQILRYISRLITEEKDADFAVERSYVRFFNLLKHLISSKSLTPRLMSGGILVELMGFLKKRSRFKWICSAAVNTIEVFLNASPESYEDFANNDGFSLLIECIRHEVDFALENPGFCGGAPDEAIVHYSISIRQVSLIRNLFLLVSNCIQSDLGDRLRNLFDSPILFSFNKVLLNPNVFGPSVLASVIDCVFYIIHNEPTAFSILNEAKVIDTLLENFDKFFIPSSELLMALPEVIGAICLNKEGANKVIEDNIIASFFKSFSGLEYAKELVIADATTNIGCSFDELGRHHTNLKPYILKEIKHLIHNAPAFINERLNSIKFYKSNKGSLYHSPSEAVLHQEDGSNEIDSWETTPAAYLADNIYFFLGGVLQDSGQWSSDVVREIPFDDWKNFLTFSNAPVDYVTSNGFTTFVGILKYLDEESQEYVLPSLINYISEALNSERIQEFINFADCNLSFFERFEDDATNGTLLLQELNVLNSLLCTLTELVGYPYHLACFVAMDENDKSKKKTFVDNIGKLLRRSVLEEIIIRNRLPSMIAKQTDVQSLNSNSPPVQVYSSEPLEKPENHDGTSAKFKNTLQVRFLAYRFQKYAASLFFILARICMPKRQQLLDLKGKRCAILLTIMIADAFKDLLDFRITDPLIEANYFLVLVNIFFHSLSDKERLNKEVIQTALGICLLQNGFFDGLKELGCKYWNELLAFDPEEVSKTNDLKYISSSKCSIVKNLLSQVLMIFAKIVSVDSVPNLPSAKTYYHDGFSGDADVSLIPSFLVQCRIIGLDLLTRIVGSRSLLFNGKDVVANNIPSPLVDQVIFITKNIWMAKKESLDIPFIPLSPDNISPPKIQIDYLVSRGLSEIQAEHFFRYFHSINDINADNISDCLQILDSEDFWNGIWKENENLKPNTHIAPLERSGATLKVERSNEKKYFADCWFKMATNYKNSIESIADMLLSTYADLQILVESLLSLIESFSDGEGKEEDLGALINLLGVILRNNDAANCNSNAFARFIEFMMVQLDQNAPSVNKRYFSYGLYIMEQALSYKVLPQREELDMDLSLPETPAPYIMSDATYREIFNDILKIQNVTEIKSALSIAKIFILYSADAEYRSQIIDSTLLKELLFTTNGFIEKSEAGYETYQTIIIILLRRCYETADVIRSYMGAELKNLFKGSVRARRELTSVLKETSSLVLRDPSVYVDTLSRQVRMENYDGGNSLPSRLYLVRVKDADAEENKDQPKALEPFNSENKKDTFKPEGMVHALLTQLMTVCKADWASDDDKKGDGVEGSKHSTNDIFKNRKFAYACFLLQALVELLGSYKLAKFEFLTFSRKKGKKPLKPRFTALNFLIHQLVPFSQISDLKSIEYERLSALSSMAKLAVLALVSTPVIDENVSVDPKKEDPDMSFIRKFYAEALLKVLSDIENSTSGTRVRYSKLMDILDLCVCLLTPKFREMTGPLFNKAITKYDQFYIARCLLDKQLTSQISSIISQLDANFPDIQKIAKLCLKSLTVLGKIIYDFLDLFQEDHQGEQDEDEIIPDDDDKDDTPDLFRNSTLGMYDVEYDSEDEDDYYDDDGNLEVLMSEEVSDDNSDSSRVSDLESNIESELGESGDEISLEEPFDGESSTVPGLVGEDDEIEVIDEIDMDSLLGSHDETTNNEYSDESDAFEFDDNEISEYDDDELDGWIEAFEEDHESSNEADTGYDDALNDIDTVRRNTIESREGFDDSAESEEDIEDEELSNFDVDYERDPFTPSNESRRRARDFANSFFDALRPAIGESNVASFLDGLFSPNTGLFGNGGLLRGTILIDRPGNNRLERSFGNILPMGSKSKKEFGSLSSMFIKSTRERWLDSLNLFYANIKDTATMNVIPAIINAIKDESAQLYKKKKEEADVAKKEREERMRKKEEEERLKQEERERQRANSASEGANGSLQPVIVRIGDREVDISGTDIDPEFFEALPDDMREEVFTQHIRERRANAANTGTDAREIDPDFLDALPPQIREEILQQESAARRFSAIEDELSFQEGDEDEEDLDSDYNSNGNGLNSFILRLDTDARRRSTSIPSPPAQQKKSKKTFFMPLVDKSGVIAITRLLFIPQSINQREHIHQTMRYLCYSRQSRIELMNTLISILYEGLVNQRSMEKIFTHLSIRSNNKASNPSYKKSSQYPIGATTMVVGVQVIEAIHYLLENDSHLRYYMLTEHENLTLFKKPIRKNGVKIKKEDKFPINILFRLLENIHVCEEQTFVDILARVLQISTRPLHLLQEAKDSNEQSKAPPIEVPLLPDYNYRQIIKVLVSNDCPNITFRRAISTMQNLSILPDAQKIFSHELSHPATSLGQIIIGDLKQLTKDLSVSRYDESENKLLSKFSASSSNQAKLLRILTALDYMFESKGKEKSGSKDEELENPFEAATNDYHDEIEELTGLYKKLALGTLWDALSDCLRVIEDKGITSAATALLPLIEALMVVCKHSKVKELQIKDAVKFEAKKIDFAKEPIESLFFSFTDEHKKILNQMVRVNPNLMSGPFGMLVRNPGVLEFDNKKNYFDRKLHQNNDDRPKLAINVRRDQVFLDTYRALFFRSKDEFRNSKLEVSFKGESGVDAGGVTREWYQVLSRQMFNPDYALFIPVASDETTFHPNRTSYVNPEHLSFFKFIGKIIGKAIYDGCFLDCHFSRAVYKRILGKPVSLKDMETLDLEYFKSLVWILENDITDVITEDFSVETDDYGEHKIIDLIPNGRNIAVTEENKQEFVRLVVEYRLQTSVAEQMDNFLQGFHEIIPKELVAIFNEQELELLISGLPDIDVQDWQNNTTYNNYSPSSEQIQWLWRAVKSFDNEERAKLLQFATGTSKVPLNGFKELSGANGTCKFSIHRDYGSTDRLPSSHTCFNQIDLPAYESYETLRGSLLLAISEGYEGFGLA